MTENTAKCFRLLRSRAFWFGVPGLVFLLWAWAVSFYRWSGVGILGPGGGGIMQIEGEVIVWISSSGFPLSGNPRFFQYEAYEGLLLSLKSSVLGTPDFVGGASPHCVLVLGYVAAWAGLLVWRKRKYRMLPVGTEVK